jgi:hypothetical protein
MFTQMCQQCQDYLRWLQLTCDKCLYVIVMKSAVLVDGRGRAFISTPWLINSASWKEKFKSVLTINRLVCMRQLAPCSQRFKDQDQDQILKLKYSPLSWSLNLCEHGARVFRFSENFNLHSWGLHIVCIFSTQWKKQIFFFFRIQSPDYTDIKWCKSKIWLIWHPTGWRGQTR